MERRLVLEREQIEQVLAALAPECPMEARSRGPQQEGCAALFRRLAATKGYSSFQWHPQRLAGRVQTIILRPDLSIEVWEQDPSRRYEDLETTCALSPVRERLDALARRWGLQEPLPVVLNLSATTRERLSGLAERRAVLAS